MDTGFTDYLAERRLDPLNPVAGLNIIFGHWLEKMMDRETEKDRKIFFITVNPVPTVSDVDFVTFIQDRLMKRVIMKGAHYVFEQRSQAYPAHGFHCHMVLEKRMSPKQIHDRIFNTVKSMVGHPKHVDVRVYPYSFLDEKLAYMRGEKWDEEKQECVTLTKQWQKTLDIQRIFTA